MKELGQLAEERLRQNSIHYLLIIGPSAGPASIAALRGMRRWSWRSAAGNIATLPCVIGGISPTKMTVPRRDYVPWTNRCGFFFGVLHNTTQGRVESRYATSMVQTGNLVETDS